MENDSVIPVSSGTTNTTNVAGKTDGQGNFQQKVIRGDEDMDSARYQTRVLEAILVEMQNHNLLTVQLMDQLNRASQSDY